MTESLGHQDTVTTTTKITPDPCGREGCERPSAVSGLCNAHYMAQYRATQERLAEEETSLGAHYGSPSEWACDGSDQCEEVPVVLYAPHGDVDGAQALCPAHRQFQIEDLRLDLRRLGAKA